MFKRFTDRTFLISKFLTSLLSPQICPCKVGKPYKTEIFLHEHEGGVENQSLLKPIKLQMIEAKLLVDFRLTEDFRSITSFTS